MIVADRPLSGLTESPMTLLTNVVSAKAVTNFRSGLRLTQMTTVTPNASMPVQVIRPRGGAWPLDFAEMWRYRDLLWFLALRDVQVIYKQTLLGVLWAIIRPVLSMVVFTLLMGKVLGIERMSDPVYVFAGLVPWSLFASYVTASTNSLVNNAALVTKIYFPRLLMPLSAIGVPLVDFVMSMVVLGVMMLCLGSAFGVGLLLIVPLVFSTIIAALGVGIGLSAVTVYFRDVRHAIPFLIQTMFFVTPVMYPKSIIPQAFHWVYWVNPIAGPIEAFRAVITAAPVDGMAWACSTAVALFLFAIGVYGFGRAERKFADVV